MAHGHTKKAFVVYMKLKFIEHPVFLFGKSDNPSHTYVYILSMVAFLLLWQSEKLQHRRHSP